MVIEYGDALVVAVENKIRTGVFTAQPTSINTGEVPVVFDRQVRTVAWQGLLESFADISQRGLISGAE